jgi:SAM-dependent methyltransferase
VPVLGLTLFASAFLLFVCQPMVGKMVLPFLGGAAAVWTTCVLFFQVMLLAGYVYAHALGRVRDVRKQILTHGLVLLLPLAFLPIRFAGASTESLFQHPSLQLLLRLAASVGVPFFVVSTTAPLLQNWLSRTEDSSARDPYFLYSASNMGSLLALIAYPFLMEPRVGVAAQSRLWFVGYTLLLALLVFASALLWQRPRAVAAVYDRRQHRNLDIAGSHRRPLQWVAAAFVPSGLMLAVTNHIAANLASAPFLWTVPLAIYLLTFIFAFARRFRVTSARVSRLIPVVLLATFPAVAAGVVAPPGLNWIIIGGHLILLCSGALLCHTALAESRPAPQHLTEFYFWIALGGVLGGVFTAIIAPAGFKTVLEYPLIVATLAFFRSGIEEKPNWLVPVLFGAVIFVIWIVFRATGLDSSTEAAALAHTSFIFVCYKLKNHVQRFAATFAVLIMAYSFILPDYIEGANRAYVGRNFFGVKKVLDEPATHLRKFLHGDTLHGIESTDAARAGKPLSYYYPNGSVADIVEMLRERGRQQRFGVVGLGSGTMAAYADANHHVTFYEIDPSIEPIARQYFTFLARCGSNCDVIIGDGRLQLVQAGNESFDLLMLDAFSSDSVPTHLVSREALQLYLSKLAPDGILLFHVSNRFLDVERLVSSLVIDAGLVAFSRFDDAGDLRKEGKSSANHVVAARRLEDLGSIAANPTWKRVTRPSDFQLWTDDYSNLLSLIRWH